MLTKQDFEQLRKEFVTKKEFGAAMSDVVELIQVFREEMLQEFSSLRKEIGSILRNHESRIGTLEEKKYS